MKTTLKIAGNKTGIPMALLLSVLLFFTGCKNEEAAQTTLLEVETASPIEREIIQWDEFTGRFQATDRVEIRARVSGYVDRVNFTDGQLVKKGDVLFVIDQRPFRIPLQQAVANRKQAEAELKQAIGNFDRVKELRATGAVSVEEYSRREQAMEAARARVDLSQASINDARLNLDFTEVKSPITGRVGRDLVNPGNLINGSATNPTLLTTVVSVSPIHFYFQGSETDLLRYTRLSQRGGRESSRERPNPVAVRLLDEADFDHKGHMDFVNNELDPSTGTIEGRAILDNEDGVLEPGMFGRLRLLGSKPHNAILVPDRLVQSNQTVKFVYTVGKDSVVKATNVVFGDLYAKEYRIIEEGLTGSESLLLNNLQRVQDGMKITQKPIELKFEGQDDTIEPNPNALNAKAQEDEIQ